MTETATDPIPKTILFQAVNSNPAAEDLDVVAGEPPVTVTGPLFGVGFAVGPAVVVAASVGPASAEIPTPVRAADVLPAGTDTALPRTSPSSSQKP